LQEKNISLFTSEFDSENAITGAIAGLFPLANKKLNENVKNTFKQAAETTNLGALSEGFTKAFDSIKAVEMKQAESKAAATEEGQAPWTVQAMQHIDGSLFDLEKFYSRIGYLQTTGKSDRIATDPFFAWKTMPAGSSAFTHAALQRGKIVQFIPENLPTDSLAFLQAFDAGVWATVQDLGIPLKTAIEMQQGNGVIFMQLPRMSDNLCKLAYKILQKDTVENYCYAGELYEKALEQLIEKMQPKEDQRQQLQEEFEAAISLFRTLLLMKNQHFFTDAETQAKGSGRVLIPVINPLECRDSHQLFARLPENAAEEVDATPDVLNQTQQNWDFLWALPAVDFHDLHLEENSLHSLLNKNVRAAILPSSGAKAGDGRQTALQLLTVALETTMQQKVAKLTAKIANVQKQLEEKIQGDVSSASQINNFESYAQRLDELLENPDKPLNVANLAAIRENPQPDAEKIRELIKARDALAELLQTYESGANGFGRANTILAIDERVDVAQFPYNNINSPWLQVQPAVSVAAVNGLFAGLVQQMSDTFLTIRNAENLLSKGRLLATTKLLWNDFSDEEKSWCPPVVCVLPDAGRVDEFNAILTAAADKRPVKVVLLDAEPTQMSGSFLSPSHAVLTAGFLNNAHVLQSAIGDAEHVLHNAFNCMGAAGPAVLQINAPKFSTGNSAVDTAGFAISSRFAPLFSASAQDDAKILPGLNISANPQPENTWVEVQWIQRTRDGILKQISEKLTPAHYLWLWPQFKTEFEEIAQSSLNENHRALTEYMQLAPENRTGLTGYIRMLDGGQKLHIALVSERVVRLCEQAAHFWQLLQKLQAQAILAEKPQEAAPAPDMFSAVEKQELENRILQLEQQSDQVMHEKLKSRLLHLSGYAPGSADFQETLRAFLAGVAEPKNEEV
ncbi:hypothetical protein KC799_24010, partial [candidate division KSB1 bacterium]|nr:hypothetical protein [candidate division KSB1 bacterium]